MEKQKYIHDQIIGKSGLIPEFRQQEIETIAVKIKRDLSDTNPGLIFVCTHNSRRSQFAHFWASYFTSFFNLPYQNFSAGTEKTAVYPSVLGAIKGAGFKINEKDGAEHPVLDGNTPIATLSSKTIQDPSLPHQNFGAIMTCNDADQNCPFIPGSSFRHPLPFVDPKHSDGTAEEAAVYHETFELIGQQMHYLFRLLSSKELGE